MSIRPVKRVAQSQPTLEGAGVHLRRAFGFGTPSEFDPFLLFDDFRNDDPDAYLAGFPWHPHRGIETITYVLAGTVDHGDSLGNRGGLGAGDVQWMTAGSGILHQEMPKGDPRGRMHEVIDDDGTRARVVCGDFWGKSGPVDGVAASPRYLDIAVPPGVRKHLAVETSNNAFAYVFEGTGTFRDASEPRAVETELVGIEDDANGGHGDGANAVDAIGNCSLVVFDHGDEVVVQAGEQGVRFLLVSGQPIEEPVAWRGPIVMNTTEQLHQAYAELRAGTFHQVGKWRGRPDSNRRPPA